MSTFFAEENEIERLEKQGVGEEHASSDEEELADDADATDARKKQRQMDEVRKKYKYIEIKKLKISNCKFIPCYWFKKYVVEKNAFYIFY
jgi:hypothetical protein